MFVRDIMIVDDQLVVRIIVVEPEKDSITLRLIIFPIKIDDFLTLPINSK
jgi:hypothetical protein